MKTFVTLLVSCLVVVSLLAPTVVSGQTLTSTKLSFHGKKMASDSSSFGLAGWFILPNPGKGTIVGVTGPRFSTKSSWIELMAGARSKNQVGEFLFDIRASYDVWKPLHFWTNLEYLPKSGDGLIYVEANYEVGTLFLIGVESENVIYGQASPDRGFGPRLVIPYGKQFKMVGSYQYHGSGYPNQVWLRTVVDL